MPSQTASPKPKLWTQIARELQTEQRYAQEQIASLAQARAEGRFRCELELVREHLEGRPVLQLGRDEDM